MNSYQSITSTANPLIKSICKLQQASERHKQQQFIAEGRRTVATIAEQITPIHVFVSMNELAFAHDTHLENITVVSEPVMKKLSTTSTPSGIFAVFPIPQPAHLPRPCPVLAKLADPGNAGTLIRTAAAMGYEDIVFIDGVDPWNPKVIQASAGTIAHIAVHQLTWKKLLQIKEKAPLCALVVQGGHVPSKALLKNSFIVVGNEAHGLEDAWAHACEQKISLPMPGKTESLNVAVAGSIALYLAKN